MSKLELFIDMDEVLCDLSEDIRLRVNKDFNKDYPKGFNKNYWWADYGIDRRYFENSLNEKDLFLNLKPVDGAIETLNKLHEEGYSIHILTCPQINYYCFYEKALWVKKHLPFIDIETNFNTTGNKGLFSKENRVLIDDNPVYLQQWLDNGGIPIVFNQGWNQDFEGDRAFNWDDVYEIIKQPRSFYELSKTIKPLYLNFSNIDVEKLREYMKGVHYE